MPFSWLMLVSQLLESWLSLSLICTKLLYLLIWGSPRYVVVNELDCVIAVIVLELLLHLAQSAVAAEYTDCISAEEKDPPHNACPGYDIKQSDRQTPVNLELLRMRSIRLLLSLPVPLWPGVLVSDWVLSMSQI